MNLLTDRLLTVKRNGEPGFRCSLPELYELAAKDEILDWPALRPHQYPAWHMFLVQLAVLAHQAAEKQVASADDWLAALRALTEEFAGDEPWRLVVDDWSLPAFLQPPCPVGSEVEYRNRIGFADSLDLLITAKNHDLKADRMANAAPEQWLYSLVSLQTTEGFLGAGNYGIARMNGGFASRPMLRCHSAGLGVGGQVMRDVHVLLQNYDAWRDNCEVGKSPMLQPLLWLLPWDGKSSLPLDRFHPLAIEVCRRIRLRNQDDRLFALGAGSKVARVGAKLAKGSVGCPWAPIHVAEEKSFSLTSNGLGYRQMVDLLDPKKYRLPLLAKPREAAIEGGKSIVVIAAGIARGQGKTEGVHERRVLLSAKSSQRLMRFSTDRESDFTRRSRRFVEMAGNVSGKALRPALIQRAQGKEDPDWKNPATDACVAPWIKRFNEVIDQCFFLELDQSFAEDESDRVSECRWSRVIEATAKQIFQSASASLPVRSEAHVLAEAWALGRLRSGLYKQLPALLTNTEENTHETA